MVRFLATFLLVIFGFAFYGQNPSKLPNQSDMIMLGVPKPSEPVNDIYAELEDQISSLNLAIAEYHQKLDSIATDTLIGENEKREQISWYTDTINQAKQIIETNHRILNGRVIVHTAEKE